VGKGSKGVLKQRKKFPHKSLKIIPPPPYIGEGILKIIKPCILIICVFYLLLIIGVGDWSI